jgi:hypothetical protein
VEKAVKCRRECFVVGLSLEVPLEQRSGSGIGIRRKDDGQLESLHISTAFRPNN